MAFVRAVSNNVSNSTNISDSSPFGLPELSSGPLFFLKFLLNLSPPARKREFFSKFLILCHTGIPFAQYGDTIYETAMPSCTFDWILLKAVPLQCA